MTHQIAEYTVDGIGGHDNSRTPSDRHGQFIGYVSSDSNGTPIPPRGTSQQPAKQSKESNEIELDMDHVAEMQREHEERLARMEAGGSYWSE